MSATKAKTANILMPSGPFQSIRLLKFYGDEAKKLTAAQIVNALNGMAPFNPEKSPRAGFTDIESSGKTITADMYAAYDIHTQSYNKKGEPQEKESFVTIEKGSIIIRMDYKLVEIRGSSRLASRFRTVLYGITEVKADPLEFEKSARKDVYETLTKSIKAPQKINVTHIVYSNVVKYDVDSAEFRGDNLQNKAEVYQHGTFHGGTIARFTGVFVYPSGTDYKTSINFDNSSVLLFKTSDGILEKDLRWIIKSLSDASA